MNSHAEVIQAFGGIRPLAVLIGVKPERGIHWHKRGIPAKYWLLVEAAAKRERIAVTAHDLQRLAPQLTISSEAA